MSQYSTGLCKYLYKDILICIELLSDLKFIFT